MFHFVRVLLRVREKTKIFRRRKVRLGYVKKSLTLLVTFSVYSLTYSWRMRFLFSLRFLIVAWMFFIFYDSNIKYCDKDEKETNRNPRFLFQFHIARFFLYFLHLLHVYAWEIVQGVVRKVSRGEGSDFGGSSCFERTFRLSSTNETQNLRSLFIPEWMPAVSTW